MARDRSESKVWVALVLFSICIKAGTDVEESKVSFKDDREVTPPLDKMD